MHPSIYSCLGADVSNSMHCFEGQSKTQNLYTFHKRHVISVCMTAIYNLANHLRSTHLSVYMPLVSNGGHPNVYIDSKVNSICHGMT